ncbi:ABC transporter permease [Occallatibacter riparius]|uniref:ABC transporter permease n=1 Tax=Occallatibacter riparius TaxID=1002689 RepID=A0A9J7BV34_9BACT|nr:ABC transporter permease [Occallatibacter riparius]UWZ86425.1 ABC transporter permease [Occallatibacter riparius]
MRAFLLDVRYALRQLRRSPGFTFTVVLMLALGIGTNTAVFSVMNAVLFELLPVSRGQGLRHVRMANGQGSAGSSSNTGDSNTAFTEATFEALRSRTDVFEELIAYVPLALSKVAVRHGELPEEATGEEVSGNFFSGLGARIERGRGLTLADEKTHASVVVLNYDFWTRSYAQDPEVVGQTLYIKGVPMTVVGVATHGFEGVEPLVATDFWIPLQNVPALNAWGAPADVFTLYGSPRWWCVRMIARLRPGVTSMQAQQALAGTFGEVVRQAVGPVDPTKWKPLLDFVPARGLGVHSDEAHEPARIMMALVGLVLVIACINVAMMVQARNSARQQEFSVRVAIGAGRISIFRQLLCESLLLVSSGAALGWLLAFWTTRLLSATLHAGTAFDPDRTVLMFTLLLSTVAAVGFGLVPLWSATHAPVAGVLRTTAANITANKVRLFGSRILLTGQIAICLVLLMTASLLLRTLRNYAAQDLGAQMDGLLVFGVTPQGQGDTHVFYRTLIDRLRQVPGVESVSMAQMRPGSGMANNDMGFVLDGVIHRGEMLRHNSVGSGFNHTMGIPLVAGRDITDADTVKSSRVALVNQTFVKKYLGNTNPLGHVLGWGKDRSTIVGVVADSKYTSVDEEQMPMAFYAQMQASSLAAMHIEVRTRGSALAVLPELRKTVAGLYPDVPLEQPMTQQAQFEESYARQRMLASMACFFGVLAALLVAAGLFGLHSFRVSRRTAEIGLRIALGATRPQMLAMVMRESLWVMLAGLAVGIPLTFFAARPLQSMLYQMSPLDPASFALAIAAMILICVCAALAPARRAASIEPMQALRSE